jgi:hypothetical protein
MDFRSYVFLANLGSDVVCGESSGREEVERRTNRVSGQRPEHQGIATIFDENSVGAPSVLHSSRNRHSAIL